MDEPSPARNFYSIIVYTGPAPQKNNSAPLEDPRALFSLAPNQSPDLRGAYQTHDHGQRKR